MFGTNSVMKQFLTNDSLLLVKELFPTIQGEGPDAGCPAFFVRLGGCNLRCLFCDTDFESDLKWFDIDMIVKAAVASRCELVVLTGGEPFRQNITPLCEALLGAKKRVQIETAGTLWAPALPLKVDIVVSPKTSLINGNIMNRAVAFKYIVRYGETDPDTGLPNINPQTGKPMKIAAPPNLYLMGSRRVWIQPCDDHDDRANAKNLQEAVSVVRKHGYRLSLQQHKIIGMP